ncbi:hypothetical protein D9M68_682620 [compost metagenome]
MIDRLRFIFERHFKLMLALNISLSLFLCALFYIKGFDKTLLYTIALFNKGIGYAVTIAIEKLFFGKRSFYYKNLGISYGRLFSMFFILDVLIFITLLLCAWLLRSFI